MTKTTVLTSAVERALALGDVDDRDRSYFHDLNASVDRSQLLLARVRLAERFGEFPAAPISREDTHTAPGVWELATLLELAASHDRLLARALSPEIVAATLADLGQQCRLHRAEHGNAGLGTWHWLSLHASGSLFRIGRLQYHLRRIADAENSWEVDVHIPAGEALAPATVDGSLSRAAAFFRTHFPQLRIDRAVCTSWLFDPWLLERMKPTSNILSFAHRFQPRAATPEPTDALYFTFGTRDMGRLHRLSARSGLQSLVLERLRTEGTWFLGRGEFRWLAS
ncbi:acyltransferase domain-containing protein [Glutamicibacter endophyticus]|uniref:acyltransferase domain-containing protein n=1 Tax=Glutamicibacter endophyticus TaxID=1522174 RepID=UPI003AF1C3B0